jgi:hypothetical protein
MSTDTRMSYHGIPEIEWRRRFREQFLKRLNIGAVAELDMTTTDAEAETWFEEIGDEEPEWLTTLPEVAAEENLSYWTE